MGRFLSADTLIASFANPQSLNRFSYVYNNPINNTDPTGHKSTDSCQYGWFDGHCASAPTPPTKGNTTTNGSGNTTADNATSAGDTGDDGTSNVSPEGLGQALFPQVDRAASFGFEWLCVSGGQYSTCSEDSHVFAVYGGKYLVRMWITESEFNGYSEPDGKFLELTVARSIKYFFVDPKEFQKPHSLYSKAAQFENKIVDINEKTSPPDVGRMGFESTMGCIAASETCGEVATAVVLLNVGGKAIDSFSANAETGELISLFYKVPAPFMQVYLSERLDINNITTGPIPKMR